MNIGKDQEVLRQVEHIRSLHTLVMSRYTYIVEFKPLDSRHSLLILSVDLWVLPFPLEDCSVFDNFVITLIVSYTSCILIDILQDLLLVSWSSNTNPTKNRGELRCSWRVCSSCSTSGIHRVTLVTNPVISHEYRKGPGSATATYTPSVLYRVCLVAWLIFYKISFWCRVGLKYWTEEHKKYRLSNGSNSTM
jgi:hypothetical protein